MISFIASRYECIASRYTKSMDSSAKPCRVHSDHSMKSSIVGRGGGDPGKPTGKARDVVHCCLEIMCSIAAVYATCCPRIDQVKEPAVPMLEDVFREDTFVHSHFNALARQVQIIKQVRESPAVVQRSEQGRCFPTSV